jgi:hypothetical protein
MKTLRIAVVFILLTLSLTACGVTHFSPEAAVTDMILHRQGPDFTVDPDTVQARQTARIEPGVAVVLVTFQGTRANSGPERCVHSYKAERFFLGWQSGSGGGSCYSDQMNDEIQPMRFSGGISTSSRPGDPGLSEVSGLVTEPSITQVRLTWKDGRIDEVDVAAETFIITRSGQFEMQKIEGLNDQGEVVYQQSH